MTPSPKDRTPTAGDSERDRRLEVAIETAQRWALFDPDPRTRSAIDRLVQTRSEDLIDLFGGRVDFGTAGLRAAVGPGPTRINAVVVRQTTVALVDWLASETKISEADQTLICIGHDGRADSQAFARHCAAATASRGARYLLAERACPTPVVAHAGALNQASATVVVTASHNPASDNGYKLYLGDGLQIVEPHDRAIAAQIDQTVKTWSTVAIDVDDCFGEVEPNASADLWERQHRDAVLAWIENNAPGPKERLGPVAYTPMHGVAGLAVIKAFAAAGLERPLIVEEQFHPDPKFATVDYPNPEEAGAMDRVIELARREVAVAAFANDPDGDRFAMAVWDRDRRELRPLSGNQTGVLLADYLLRRVRSANEVAEPSHQLGSGSNVARTATNQMGADASASIQVPALPEGDGKITVLARSVVSTRLLDAIAAHHGARCRVTLTGFKWIARPMVEEPASRYLFGFEEALGYCVGDTVRDKDGISCGVVAAQMLAWLDQRGETVWDRLETFDRNFGFYRSGQVTVRLEGSSSGIDRLESVKSQISAILGDATLGDARITRSGTIGFGSLPVTPGFHLEMSDNTQVIARPSGTESKLKIYVECVEPPNSTANAAERRLGFVISQIREVL